MGTIRVRVTGDDAEVTSATVDGSGNVKEIWGGGGGSRLVPIDTAELAVSLRGLTSQLGDLFVGMREVAGFELQQVQVGLEISAEGGFNLIGSMKAGGKGAITLSFAPAARPEA